MKVCRQKNLHLAYRSFKVIYFGINRYFAYDFIRQSIVTFALASICVCLTGFYRLRQLRRVRRSLDSKSAATLVHAFVTSRIDYCNVLLAEALKVTIDNLQRLLNVVARTRKFDCGLSQVMHDYLHWLDVPSFRRLLKTRLFSEYTQRIRGIIQYITRYMNLRLSYLLTYLLALFQRYYSFCDLNTHFLYSTPIPPETWGCSC